MLSKNSSGLPPTNPNDLKTTLECQMDIVLKLEEERLELLKENRIQREKIRELTLRADNSVLKKQITINNKDCQTDAIILAESHCQTDDLLAESKLTEISEISEKSQKKTVVDEASEYLSKYSELLSSGSTVKAPESSKKTVNKKNLSEKMPMKSLKFASEKENKNTSNFDESQVAKNLRNEKDILAQELINLNREITRLKTENRIASENFKRVDKERLENKKMLEVKTELVDKLKAENYEMTIILNTDQFKTIRNLESELKKILIHNKELIHELGVAKTEKNHLEEEMKDFKTHLDVLTEEIEKKLHEEKKTEKIQEQNKRLEESVKELEHKLQLKQEELDTRQKTVDEMLRENDKLNDDVNYFKNLAKTAKAHAEKAVADVDVYKRMLGSNA